MTGEQKKVIEALRRDGLGYRKIAARLGISENTVKTYIRRNSAAAESPGVEIKTGCCLQCDVNLAEIAKRKSRKYCSDTCRRAWWKAHGHMIDRLAWYSCVCAACGKDFKSYGNKNRKYCGHSCYINAHFNNMGVRI